MANPFFQQGNNLMQTVQSFRQNPMQMLLQRRLNVPQSMMNDPNAIMQHLLSTGQRSQQQMNAAYQMAARMGYNPANKK